MALKCLKYERRIDENIYSIFIFLYIYISKSKFRKEELPKRVGTVIDKLFVKRVMVTLKEAEKLNLKANETNMYGLVIYPK